LPRIAQPAEEPCSASAVNSEGGSVVRRFISAPGCRTQPALCSCKRGVGGLPVGYEASVEFPHQHRRRLVFNRPQAAHHGARASSEKGRAKRDGARPSFFSTNPEVAETVELIVFKPAGAISESPGEGATPLFLQTPNPPKQSTGCDVLLVTRWLIPASRVVSILNKSLDDIR